MLKVSVQGYRASFVALLSVIALLVCAHNAAAADLTWSGEAPAGSFEWSNAGNWSEGGTPSGTVGTLRFPLLGTGTCASGSPTGACYVSQNDVPGLTVGGIAIEDGTGYLLQGQGITLGSGGITATISKTTTVNLPITLGAPQVWSLTGGAGNAHQLDVFDLGGPSSTLGVNLASQAFLQLHRDSEVGAVTISGTNTSLTSYDAGGNGAVALPPSAKLNASNGHAVAVNHASLVGVGGAVGPLTVNAGVLQVGGGTPGTIDVAGDLALNAQSGVILFTKTPGSQAGTDYSQIRSIGNVNLGGAAFTLMGGPAGCPTLAPGTVETLLTATGSVSGTFAGIADGQVISVSCGPQAAALRINYTAHAVTATVLSPPATTTTTLSVDPPQSTTNQMVTLTATVSATSGGAPTGSINFTLGPQVSIAGCQSRPVALVGALYQASCETSLAPTDVAGGIGASFTPADATAHIPSSAYVPYQVLPGATTTTVLPSATSVEAGASVTYVATVTPQTPGARTPTGSVEFRDGDSTIADCASQPLNGPGAMVATCTVSGPAAGSHDISAVYQGDVNFGISTSPTAVVTVASPGAPGPAAGGPPVTPTGGQTGGTGIPTPTPIKGITTSAAREAAIKALARKFKKAWTKSTAKKVSCAPSGSTARCTVSFRYRGKKYSGTAAVTTTGTKLSVKAKKR